MATLRDIKNKIGAVKKTMQITRAMNMVAASKLRNVQGRMESFDPYARKFAEVLGNLASRIDSGIHPLLGAKENVSKVELLHFSADRGLCGSFNMNSLATAEKWLKEQKAKNLDCSLTLVGKKGRDYFRRRGYKVNASHVNVYSSVNMVFVAEMTKNLIDRFMSDEIHEVYMIYSRFLGMGRQEPTVFKLLPIEPPKTEVGIEEMAEYLCEPSAEELLVELLPNHLNVQIYNAFLQNETSEHSARMAAMDNATKNCSEMIENLTLIYNKARQASITAELMDIVGGAEALR